MHFSIRIDSKVLDAEVNSKGSFSWEERPN
jgi:hypothetical protein